MFLFALAGGQFGQQRQLLTQQFEHVVECQYAGKCAGFGNHGYAPYTASAHALGRVENALLFRYLQQCITHDITHGDFVEGNILGNDLDYQIAIGNDANRLHETRMRFDDNQAADMVIPHQPGGFRYGCFTGGRDYLAITEFPGFHDDLLVESAQMRQQ